MTPLTDRQEKERIIEELTSMCNSHSSNCSQNSWAGYGETNPPRERCFCGYYDVFDRKKIDIEKMIDALLASQQSSLVERVREMKKKHDSKFFYDQITHADEELKEIQSISMRAGYNQAIDTVLSLLEEKMTTTTSKSQPHTVGEGVARIFYQWWGTGHFENRQWTLLDPYGEVEDYNTRKICVAQAKKMGWKYQVERHSRKVRNKITILETNL